MAEDIIGFGDLFDFNDEAPINKGLQGIEKLEKGYAEFIKKAVQGNQELRQEMNQLATQMRSIGKELGNVSVASREGRKEAAQMSALLNKQTKQYADLKVKLQDQVNKTRELSKQHRDLQKSYNLLSKARAKAAKDDKAIATAEAKARIAIDKRTQEARVRLAEATALSKIRQEERVTKAQEREADRRIADARREATAIARAAEKERLQRGASGSINDLKFQRDKLTNNFNNLGNSPFDLEIKAAQVAEVNRLTKAINESQAAMLLARKGTIAARDSYAGLVQENARLIRQMKLIPGAFDKATGKINEHNAEVRQLQAQYRQNTMALKGFDERLGMNYRNVGNYSGALTRVGGSLKQFALGLAGQFAAMYALSEATRIAFQDNLALADAQSAVQKTVGMTKAEVDALAQSFKNIDTRTSLAGLFDIAKVGGQFGVAAEDIGAFTEAANQAGVALSDEFKGGVEEIATELYTLRGLFDETREMNPAEAMMRIGSAINSLGASGAATGPVIAEFAKRLGQLGDMGPTIGDALGLGAALQELGFSAEIASGGYTNLVIQLSKNVDEIAGSFGITTDEFRKMLDADPTELILQMAEAMGGLEESTKILEGFGIMSQESIKVFNSMGVNAELVRKQMRESNKELERAQSITDEYTIANTNLAASWDKVKKNIFEPLVSGAVGNGLQKLLDKFNEVSNFLRGTGNGVADATEQQALRAAATAEQSVQLDKLIMSYEELRAKSNLSEAEQEKLSKIMVKIKNIVGDTALILDEETRAYTVNIDAILDKQVALEKLTKVEADKAKGQLTKLEEERKRVEDEVRLLATEKEILQEEVDKQFSKNSGFDIGDSMKFLTTANDKKEALERLRLKENELYDMTMQLEAIELKQKAALRETAKAAITAKDAYQEMLPWLQKAKEEFSFFPKDGFATGGLEYTGGDDKETDEEKEARLKAAADAAKRLREAAAEARNQLALLEAQIRLTRAEWVKLSAEELDWEMPDIAKGMSEQAGFIKQELDKIGRIYDAQAAALDFYTQERVKKARAEAEDKLKNNKAGADGVVLIERELEEDIAVIMHERDLEHKRLTDKRIEREEKAVSTITKINKDYEQERADAVKAIMDKEAKDWFESKKALEQALFDFGGELGNAYFDIRQQRMEAEMEMLKYNYEQQLAAAGDNEELKAQLNETYAKKELKLRQEQAKNQKKQAMFNIFLSTAMAVMNAMANVPPPFNFGVAALVGAMGAAQLLVAASQPIPQFFRGVKDSPEGPAKVAETSPELAISPDGRLTYYDRPQVAMLERGTEVKTGSETKAILSRMEKTFGDNGTKILIESFDSSQRSLNAPKKDSTPTWGELTKEMRKGTRQMVRAINNQRTQTHNPDGSMTERNGQKWNTYVNKKYKR